MELLNKLTQTYSPSGNEEKIRRVIVEEVSGYADSVTTDNMGNLIVRKKGRIVIKSTYAGTTNIDLSYFVVNEITIMGSRCGPFPPALALLNKGLVNLPPIELWSLEDYEKAFASRAFKVGFKF